MVPKALWGVRKANVWSDGGARDGCQESANMRGVGDSTCESYMGVLEVPG